MMRILAFLCLAACLVQCKPEKERPQKKQVPTTVTANQNPFVERMKQNPDNLELYIQSAEFDMNAGQFGKALGTLSQLLKKDSTNSKVYLLRGESYYSVNKTREAKEDWERCVKLDPESVACRLKLAQLFMLVEAVKESFEHIEEVLKLDPKNAEAYFIAGMNHKTRRDTIKAIDSFQQSVDISPTVQGFELLGVLYAGLGNEVALDYYQKALDLDPNTVTIYYNLGRYYQEKEEWNKAMEHYTRAIQLQPGHVPALYAMGYIHVELKMWQDAVGYFSRTVNVKDNHYQAWYGRGYAYEMMGDVQNAERSYQKCLSHIDDYGPALAGMKRLQEGEKATAQ